MTWWHYCFNVSGDGLSTAHGDAWLLPTLPTSPLLNVTDPSAKSLSGNPFDSSSLCTGRGGFPALQPCRACLTGSRFSFLQTAWGSSWHVVLNRKFGIWRGRGLQGRHWWNSALNWPNECKFSNPLLRELNWQMIRNQYLIYIHSLSCNTPNQFSFLQSWDICAAAEPIMLSLLCEDSYAIKYYKKNIDKFQKTIALRKFQKISI